MDIQFGSVEAIAQAASYTDNAAAYMDLDAAGGYAQFGAKTSGGGSLGTKIRTILAGVVQNAITIASRGLLIPLLAGSTLAAQAISGTTLTTSAAGGVSAQRSGVPSQYLKLDNETGDSHLTAVNTGSAAFLNLVFQQTNNAVTIIPAYFTMYHAFHLQNNGTPGSLIDGDLWWDGSHFYGRVGGVSKQLDN